MREIREWEEERIKREETEKEGKRLLDAQLISF